MKNINILIVLILLILVSCKTNSFDPEITSVELENTVKKLASEQYAGRIAGSIENAEAAKFLAYQFAKAGLNSFNENYVQAFNINEGYVLDETNSIEIEGILLNIEKEYSPFSFSKNGEVLDKLSFHGFGLKEEKGLIWNDYPDSIQTGWVMIFSGVPDSLKAKEKFYSDRDKAMVAMQNGAKGVLIVSKNNELVQLNANSNAMDIPVLNITWDKASEILKTKKIDINSLLEKNRFEPNHDHFELNLKGTIQVNPKEVQLQNVFGYFEGSDELLKNEYIIIGAHYDHLGMGGHTISSRMPDTIAVHGGADDNASGVAAIIEIMQKIQSQEIKPERSIIFAFFDGEEKGLLGSKHMTEHLPVDKGQIKGMINLDMVGRLKTDSLLIIGGYGTSLEAESIIESTNQEYNFNLTISKEGYGPSDHAAFYSLDIPVFYLTTGPHDDYHTPFDLYDRINYDGLKYVSEFTYDLLTNIANGKALTFQEAGPKQQADRHSSRFKVTLGVMPDFFGVEKKGLRIDLVVDGKPAYLGGMKKGDIVIDINGNKVGGIEDYMYWLKKLEPGQRILVEVLRGEKKEILTIQL